MMTRSKTRPRVIFSIVGFLLLIIAFLVLNSGGDQPSENLKFWSASILSLAFIFLTIVVVDLFWQILGGEPVGEALQALRDVNEEVRSSFTLLHDSKKSGLCSVVAASGEFGSNEVWMARLKGAAVKIDLMGYNLLVWTKGADFESEVVDRVKAGVHIRVLMMDEGNPDLPAFVNHHQVHGTSVSSVTEDIKAATAAFVDLGQKISTMSLPGSFTFRKLKKGMIVTQICRMDSQLTSIQYLYSAIASRNPLVEVRGVETKLFKVYMKEFEAMWDLAA